VQNGPEIIAARNNGTWAGTCWLRHKMDWQPREKTSEGMAPKGNIVEEQVPSPFTHTTLTSYPDTIVGVTLLDESPGVTGIYLRDRNGGLWPARTVNRLPTEDYQTICDSWLARPGVNEDKRTL
jgi:hypothetical protein